MNRNSVKNQEIKRKFVDREVYCNVNSMVDYIIKKAWDDQDAPFNLEDVENYYVPVCPECGNNTFTEGENEEEETIYICDHCKEVFEEEPETEPQEVYEWWVVSSWLLSKLKDHNEPVIEHEQIWGRTTTGQAILLDGVISEICEELEILEGQKNEWDI